MRFTLLMVAAHVRRCRRLSVTSKKATRWVRLAERLPLTFSLCFRLPLILPLVGWSIPSTEGLAAITSAATLVAAPGRTAPAAPTAQDCSPSNGLEFICGVGASEDLAQIPRTHWLIASGLNIGSPAHLYFIDTVHRRAVPAFPRATTTHIDGQAPRKTVGSSPVSGADTQPADSADCARPPDPARQSMDGISVRPGPGGRHTVYAANHGDRIAIEIFQLDARGKEPELKWTGCVRVPPGLLPNSVVPVEDGGFLVSSFHDPRDSDAWQRMDRGENTGSVWEWRPGKGFHPIDLGGISGANGLEVSADGHEVYISAWSSRELVIVDMHSGASHRMARHIGARRTLARRIPLDFMPDNIKRQRDGRLLVAGQRSTPAAIGACGAQCPQAWTVVRVDPKSGQVEPLLSRGGTELVNYACGALELDGRLYITARGDRRIVTVAMTDLPSLR